MQETYGADLWSTEKQMAKRNFDYREKAPLAATKICSWTQMKLFLESTSNSTGNWDTWNNRGVLQYIKN
jgi:hypothetical protein